MDRSIESPNVREINALRRRRFWTGFILWAAIALMPIGCLCPCGLGIALRPERDGVHPAFGVTAIVVPLIGLAVAILMFLDRSRYARAWSIAQFALESNYSYAYRPDAEAYEYLTRAQVFSSSDGCSGMNLVQGKYKGTSFTFVDFQYYFGFGRDVESYEQTVLVLHDGAMDAPVLVLWPKGWMDRLSDLLGGTSIKIPKQAEFNKSFALSGNKKDLIVKRFSNGKLIDYCLEEPYLAMEVHSDDLILFRNNRSLAPAEYEDYLKQSLKMAALLRGDA